MTQTHKNQERSPLLLGLHLQKHLAQDVNGSPARWEAGGPALSNSQSLRTATAFSALILLFGA